MKTLFIQFEILLKRYGLSPQQIITKEPCSRWIIRTKIFFVTNPISFTTFFVPMHRIIRIPFGTKTCRLGSFCIWIVEYCNILVLGGSRGDNNVL